ncbi:P-loop containing nucleoside triphosphate hydrolase protein [Mycena vulgaris]|nr:P-loop containing nucleoside triphosphate hydrolase protein [Mycena vulgaris]
MAAPNEDAERTTHRTVPMQVLALGFGRTGTVSLKLALEALGYVRTNHGFDVMLASTAAEKDMWIAALKAKFYGEGTPFGREEWDQLLGDCQAVTDQPHILFAAELIAAYPDAKVVLTTRDVESWWASYEATVAESVKPVLQARTQSDRDTSPGAVLLQLIHGALFGTDCLTEEIAKARFISHYEEVRRLTPADRLLEFEVKEGWAPLAAFLGKEVPAMAFPRVNDRAQFNQRISEQLNQSGYIVGGAENSGKEIGG